MHWLVSAIWLSTAFAACFSGQPKQGVLNVHLIAHSHDDVGWLKTPDEYYYGANNSIQHAGVQYIYDTVMSSLLANPNRQFTAVEQAFFQRWWQEQDETMQDTVRALVKKGQLFFINGGFTQHDEANPYFVNMVHQTTLGHRFLSKEFGYVPTVGWQIDPFGHSATQGSLLSAAVGFDALYFARLDYQERDKRRIDKTMEMIWEPGKTTGMGDEGAIFTGAFVGGGYGPPDGLCFDQRCDDQPVMDDDCLEDQNADEMVEIFVQAALQYANWTLGNNVMFTMGSDFQYENAQMWYKNLDKMIHYVNKDGRVNAFYSNPEQYTKAKNEEKLQFPIREGDFFPICQEADEDSGRRGHSYWAGFFTSRPLLKYYIRSLSAFLHAAQQLQLQTTGLSVHHLEQQLDDYHAAVKAYRQCRTNSAANARSSCRHPSPPWWLPWLPKQHKNGAVVVSDLLPLSLVVADSTHHDSITGTSKQHVTYDNARRLSAGQALAEAATNDALRVKLGLAPQARMEQCRLLNESKCEISEGYAAKQTPFRVVLYNALGQTRNEYVRIPLKSGGTVKDLSTGQTVDSFVDHRGVLVFEASINPLATASYVITPSKPASPLPPVSPSLKFDNITLENQYLRVVFNASSGRIAQIVNKEQGVTVAVDQGLYWYEGDPTKGKGAGAYMFRPINVNANATNISTVGNFVVAVNVTRSSVVQVVRQTFAPWAAQEVRLYANSRDLEIEWTVGPVPVDDHKGKEIVSRWTSNIQSQGLFYTDSNGREIMERRRNYREYFTLNLTEPQAANYYPFSAVTAIKDQRAQLTVQADRAQGTTSLIDGQLEVLLMRRLLKDDGEGVGEALNETESITYEPNEHPHRVGQGIVVTGVQRISLTTPQLAARSFRQTQERMWSPLLTAFSDDVLSGPPQTTAVALPDNVFLMTTEALNDTAVLVRVAHKFALGEDEKYSSPVNVSLVDIGTLLGLKFNAVTEVSLTANQVLPGAKRLQWSRANQNSKVSSWLVDEFLPMSAPRDVLLNPLQIRTFVCQ